MILVYEEDLEIILRLSGFLLDLQTFIRYSSGCSVSSSSASVVGRKSKEQLNPSTA